MRVDQDHSRRKTGWPKVTDCRWRRSTPGSFGSTSTWKLMDCQWTNHLSLAGSKQTTPGQTHFLIKTSQGPIKGFCNSDQNICLQYINQEYQLWLQISFYLGGQVYTTQHSNHMCGRNSAWSGGFEPDTQFKFCESCWDKTRILPYIHRPQWRVFIKWAD